MSNNMIALEFWKGKKPQGKLTRSLLTHFTEEENDDITAMMRWMHDHGVGCTRGHLVRALVLDAIAAFKEEVTP